MQTVGNTTRSDEERDATTNWHELMQIALEGLPNPDIRLEDLIDRVGRPS